MTVLKGLHYFNIPCAHVLSVSGLLVITALFPLGEPVIPEVNLMPDIPRV